MVSENRKQYLSNYIDTRKRINISLSVSDYNKVNYLAKIDDTKPTSYISNLVQHQLNKTPFIPQTLTNDIKEMKLLLREISTNIYQFTHHSNTIKVMVNERALLLELQKLEKGIIGYIHKSIES